MLNYSNYMSYSEYSQKDPRLVKRSIEENTYNYRDLDYLFRCDIDAQFNIERQYEVDGQRNIIAVRRNATKAFDIDDRRINHRRVEANNALLRILGRVRGIDHAISSMMKENSTDRKLLSTLEKLQLELRNEMGNITENMHRAIENNQYSFTEIEKDFNTITLCSILRRAHLDAGCETPKDYEKLLFHYRNLAAVLDPTPTLTTVSYDASNKVIHRIIQEPVTQKTKKQREAILQDMSQVILFPAGEQKSFQTKQNMAMQTANRYFAELVSRNDRMLGAQTRKTHLHGAKNAFVVTNELVFDVAQDNVPQQVNPNDAAYRKAQEDDREYFARSATPVYIGGGETDERIQASTRANLEQIRSAITKTYAKENEFKATPENSRLHFTCLVTDSPLEKQHLMIRHSYDATRRNTENHDDITYAPCNWDGTNRRMDISDQVDDAARPSTLPTLSNQAERYRRTADISHNIRSKKGRIFEIIACGSGQDRAETLSKYASQKFARERYTAHRLILHVDPNKGDAIEATLAKSRNSAEINAHVVAGSRGCKNDSRGKSVFTNDRLYAPQTEEAMYLPSATTNKKNKVDPKLLKSTFDNLERNRKAHEPSNTDIQYARALQDLNAVCENTQYDADLRKMGSKAVDEAAIAWKKAKPADKHLIIEGLKLASTIVVGPRNGMEDYTNNLARLGALSGGLQKKSSLRKFGRTLLILGGTALVVAGILAAIPTGGGSLVLALLGAAALIAGGGLSYKGKKTHEQHSHGMELSGSSFIGSMSKLHKTAKGKFAEEEKGGDDETMPLIPRDGDEQKHARRGSNSGNRS